MSKVKTIINVKNDIGLLIPVCIEAEMNANISGKEYIFKQEWFDCRILPDFSLNADTAVIEADGY